jgi:hypothetical protein
MTITKAKPGRRAGGTGGPELGQGASSHARRVAAAILEVLAGMRTPAEAATVLELCLPRYYQLEAQALRGLLAACEPRGPGRAVSVETEQARLAQENQRLQRELLRQQALTRAAQRTVGLAPPPATPAVKPGNRRRRRVARALSVATRLRADAPTGAAATPSTNAGAVAATT